MIGVLSAINTFSRSSCLRSIVNARNISTCVCPSYFRVTDRLSGEPLKKKKRLDPAIIRAREERKKRKLEKAIRRLEKHSKQLKPIVEKDLTPSLLEEKSQRTRVPVQLSEEEVERRILLEKEWSRYKRSEWIKDTHIIESIMLSQEIALKELKNVSEELYKKAIEMDDSFIPYSVSGPVHTPPIDNYDSPDGEYANVTVKYEGEP